MRVPACLCVCVCLCAGHGRASAPRRARIPCPARRGAAGQHQFTPGPRSRTHKLRCGPGGEGFASSPAAEQKPAVRVLEPSCSAGAWPTVRLALSSHAKFLSLECLLFYLPLCSGRRRAAPREEGLKNTGACSAVAALPALVGVRCPSAGTAAPRSARADARREREEGG